jgi:hypothetical protein
MQRLAGGRGPHRKVVCGRTASHGFAPVETEAITGTLLDADVSRGVWVGAHGSGIGGWRQAGAVNGFFLQHPFLLKSATRGCVGLPRGQVAPVPAARAASRVDSR